MTSTATDPATAHPLRDSVRRFLAAHQQWQNSDDLPDPDDAYWAAVDQLLQDFSGSIPGHLRQVADAVFDFETEVDAFVNREDTDNQHPSYTFWSAIEHLENQVNQPDAIEHYRANPLPSILALEKQGVPHDQIARIWQLFHANGEPNRAAVQKELDAPGSVIAPGFDPRIVEEERKRAEFAARHSDLAETRTAIKASDAPCKETPIELFEQGVGEAQATRMLKRPLAEVQKLWNEFTVAKQQALAARDARAAAVHQVITPAANPDTEPPAVTNNTEDTSAAIRELLDEGWSAKDIAKELGVSWQKVAAEVRTLKRTEAATANE